MISQSRPLLNYWCQVSEHPPKLFSNTLNHQLNFKLVRSLINCWGAVSPNVAAGTGHLTTFPSAGRCHLQELLVVMVPTAAPAGRSDFSPQPWQSESHQAQGHWGQLWEFAVSQAPAAIRCTFTFRTWCLHGCLSEAQHDGTMSLGLLSATTMQIWDNNS